MFDNPEIVEETVEIPQEVEEVTEPEAAAEPAVTEAQVAAYLEAQGIDLSKAKNVAEWEKKVNAQSSDLGRVARELEAARTAPKPEADEPALDAETQKELKAALKAIGLDVDALNPLLAQTKQSVDEAREETFESFVAAHPDVPADDIVRELVDSGVNPQALTPGALRKELTKAYKVVKAETVDPEAIAKAAVEKYLADLATKGVKPSDVVEVKKGRGSAAGSHRNAEDVLADPNVSAFDKMKLAQEFDD